MTVIWQAKENWVKFGNPDGKQPMEVSIALPTFLLEKEHHNTILIIYLIAMVVIIPCKRGWSQPAFLPTHKQQRGGRTRLVCRFLAGLAGYWGRLTFYS